MSISKLFSLKDLESTISKTRGQSSPSTLDQITYMIFKKCPSLGPALLDLFNSCWREHHVPSFWKQGVVRLIPKAAAAENPHSPANVCPIALTFCVGKLYTTLLKDRWLRFMLVNNYLNTSVKKTFIPGIPGCFEQYRKLLTIIQDAYKKHRSLAVCWLDLANVYGSIHHQLISFCLQHYHAPPSFLASITEIYTGLSATIISKRWNTTSIPLQVGEIPSQSSFSIRWCPLWQTLWEIISLLGTPCLAAVSPLMFYYMLTTHVWWQMDLLTVNAFSLELSSGYSGQEWESRSQNVIALVFRPRQPSDLTPPST